MMKSSFLTAASALLGILAFVAPSKAGSVPFSVYSVTGGGTITGTQFAGPAITAPTFTISSVTAPGSQSAILSPPTPTFTQGAATSFEVGTYTLSGLPISGSLYQLSGNLSQTVTIETTGGKGSIVLSESVNSLVGSFGSYSNQGPIAPQITAQNSTKIGNTEFTAYYFATATVNGHAEIFVALEATTVPEPTSMALLGIGMTSFLAFRRFFKRTPVA
jgi:hypothetical protein